MSVSTSCRTSTEDMSLEQHFQGLSVQERSECDMEWCRYESSDVYLAFESVRLFSGSVSESCSIRSGQWNRCSWGISPIRN